MSRGLLGRSRMVGRRRVSEVRPLLLDTSYTCADTTSLVRRTVGDAPPASTANNQDRRRSSTSHSRSYSTSPPELSYSHSPSSLEDSPPLQSPAESRHPGRGNGSYGKERVEERRGSRAAAASSTEAAWERGRYGSETGRKSFAKQVSYEELSRGQERRGRGERDDDKSVRSVILPSPPS